MTARVPAGVVVAEGIWWLEFAPGIRSVNALTSQRLTDQGEGSTFYDNRVDVRKVSVVELCMKPELSVIVPVLNEAPTLPELFATLAQQRETTFEVVICDGGSTDGTAQLAQELAGEMPVPVRVVASRPGRARQMNSGAAASHSEYSALPPRRLALRRLPFVAQGNRRPCRRNGAHRT